MDKDTLSHYGWIIIMIIIVSSLIVFATPIGEKFGQSVSNMVMAQKEFMDNAFSDEEMSEQQEYLDQIFDTTHLLESGLYQHEHHEVMALNWTQLIEKDYITRSGNTISAGSKVTKLNGDLVVDDLVFIINANTFANATKLNLVRMGIAVQTIGDNAFSGCSTLETFIANGTLKTIGSYAFKNCSELEYVYLTNTVTSIGSYAFQNCTKLETIKFYGTQAQWNAISKGSNWTAPNLKTIICTDGNINL